MSPTPAVFSIAERYDRALVYAKRQHLPPGTPTPQPTTAWPPENIELLERYAAWRLGGGASEQTTLVIYLPMAGHVLGLALKPYPELDLDTDLEPAMNYILAKQLSQHWTNVCRNALDNFHRFLRQERGLGEVVTQTPFDVAQHTQGLPDWLVQELLNYQSLQHRNWRPARLDGSIRRFWSGHLRVWRYLCDQCGVVTLADLQRQQLFDFIAQRLEGGYAVKSINGDLRTFQAFLGFLHDQGFPVPRAMLRLPTLKEGDQLPRYLTDAQVGRLRDDLEARVRLAQSAHPRRDAVLDRAAFYLLWQAGLRLGEVEELQLTDLDLAARQLTVRQGKGLKDRSVYLTDTVVAALQAYLVLRGAGSGAQVFLYRNRPVRKDLIQARIKAAGQRTGVKVYPHRLRHTMATQLLNAGCRVTSLQQFLGHKRLSTTMIYARVHNHTVAEDYYAAMERIEPRLKVVEQAAPPSSEARDPAPLLDLIEQLAALATSDPEQAALVAQIRDLVAPGTVIE